MYGYAWSRVISVTATTSTFEEGLAERIGAVM